MTITAKYNSISNVSVTIQASPEKGGKVKYNSDPAVSSENICVHGLSKQRLELCRLEEGWRYDFLQEQKTTVADESVTYVGVFEKDKNYRATTDLVDEHFYNDKRSFTEPPEEFDGLVRTYLWKETGAQKGDNIYVMYRDKGLSYQEMASVVDDDGTVRFTLEDALIGTEFVLVRVNIESKHLPS